MKAPKPSLTHINIPYRRLFPQPQRPSPSEEEAAALQAFIEDVMPACAKHGFYFELSRDDDYEPIICIRPREDWVGAFVVFHDGEMRAEPELRDPEEVVAQVAWPKTAHQRLESASRLARIRQQG